MWFTMSRKQVQKVKQGPRRYIEVLQKMISQFHLLHKLNGDKQVTYHDNKKI